MTKPIELTILEYQYRWYDNNPNTVTYGQWYEWKPASKDQYDHINELIINDKCYETRIVYTEIKNYESQCNNCNNLKNQTVQYYSSHRPWCTIRVNKPEGPCFDKLPYMEID